MTAAFILDAYGSTGCNFIHLEVGIDPVNLAWNESSLDLGLFNHQSDEAVQQNYLMQTFHPECADYGDVFNEYFVDGDKTWQVSIDHLTSLILRKGYGYLTNNLILLLKMARILAFISGGAGALATATIWMMVLTPLPSCFFWPGILLPAVLVTLLAGGAKFLFFDTQICHDELWVPSGDDVKGQQAESCTLSRDSIIGIVSSVLSLLNVLLICLKAPTRRVLDVNYGAQYEDVENDMIGLKTDTMEDSTCKSLSYDVESHAGKSRQWSATKVNVNLRKAYDLEDIVQQQMHGQEGEPGQSRKRHPSSRSRKRSVTPRGGSKTERLRSIDPSVDHSHRDFKEVMSYSNDDSALESESVTVKTPKGERSEKGLTEDNSTKSKSTPSDEVGFNFRSPLKAFKENFSPQKASKAKKDKDWQVDEPKAYDESIIFKCIDNLENSFGGPDKNTVSM